MTTKLGNLFLITLSVFFLLYIAYLFYAKHTLKQSQEQIIRVYNAHLNDVHKIHQDVKEYTLDVLLHTESMNNGKHKVMPKEYQDIFYKDSLIIASELLIMQGQAQSMLTLHLNQIEHEYSNITIWAAVMGLLFLVFSFYSMFKMDDCVKRGHECVNKMENLEKESNKIMEKINSAKRSMDAKTSDIVEAFSKNLNLLKDTFEKETNVRIQYFDDCIKSVQEVLSQMETSDMNINKKEEYE